MQARDRTLAESHRILNPTLALLLCWMMLGLVFVRQVPHASTDAGKDVARDRVKTAVSFNRDIQPIFTANCVVCHQVAGPAQLTLEPGVAYANLVGKSSTESKMPRVAPGAPQGSYLVHKLTGTQSKAGGSGAQMPYNGSPLASPQMTLITQWIQEGAPNN